MSSGEVVVDVDGRSIVAVFRVLLFPCWWRTLTLCEWWHGDSSGGKT